MLTTNERESPLLRRVRLYGTMAVRADHARTRRDLLRTDMDEAEAECRVAEEEAAQELARIGRIYAYGSHRHGPKLLRFLAAMAPLSAFTSRDVALVLGVTRQRVHQVIWRSINRGDIDLIEDGLFRVTDGARAELAAIGLGPPIPAAGALSMPLRPPVEDAASTGSCTSGSGIPPEAR